MKCNRAVEEYIKLEDYSQMPFIMRIHLLFCAECRTEIDRLQKLFAKIGNDSLYRAPLNFSTSVMDVIRRESVYKGRSVSGFKWVTIGSVIFSSIVLLNFSESFLWLRSNFGSGYTLPLSIVMGFVITAYSVMVIGCNYEYIKKYINMHYKWKIK